MAINNQEQFVGNLFDPKFKRLEILNDEYLKYVIFYTHFNPEHHFIVDDYQQYKFSSYGAIFSSRPTRLSRNKVLELFDGLENFKNYHRVVHKERKELIIE